MTAEEIVAEREDLEELLRSGGWQRVKAYIKKEYSGEGYFQHMGKALKEGDSIDPKILHAVSEHMLGLVEVVNNRYKELKGAELDDANSEG